MPSRDPVRCYVCNGPCRYDKPVPASKKKGEWPTVEEGDPHTMPDWEHQCEVCGASPVVPITGQCGPCTFGESDTADGNW